MRLSSMRSLISVLSIAFVAGSASVADAQAVSPPALPVPQIVTSGTGEAQVVPDRASIYIGVQSRATTAAVAARDNAQRQRAVIDAIVGLGIPRAQISTESYTVAPDTRFEPTTQKTTVTGYVVSNVVRVELQRIDQVSGVLDAALAKGANQINSLDFYSSGADSARQSALTQAVGKARADAEVIARAAGGSLGSLLEVTSMDGGPRPVYKALSAQAMATPIEPGQQRLQVMVSARWAFIATK